MTTSWWGRLPELGRMVLTLIRSVGTVQRGRVAVADGVRRLPASAHSAFSIYCVLLILLGMVTAGFVLLPLALLLLLRGLLKESLADPSLPGGLLLGAIGLVYLVGPGLLLLLASRFAFGRLQHQAERLADRIEGRR